MRILNLTDNGPDCLSWRWTFQIDFGGGLRRSYATNRKGDGLFDCDDEYKQLKGTGQFTLAGKTLMQAETYILECWRR